MPMNMLWLIGAGVFVAMGAIIWLWQRRKLIRKSAQNLKVNVVDRITEKFPNVRHTEQPPGSKGAPPREGVQGNLAQTHLHDLLQYLALGSKSGILDLSCGRRSGRLWMSEGKVVKVTYRGKEGLEAAFMMMDVVEGDFEFSEQFVDAASTSEHWDVVDIIMLWMSRKPKKKPTTR